MITGVFHIIPDAQGDAQEFVTDGFVVLDRIEVATPLEPPIAVFIAEDIAMALEVLLRELADPVGRNESLRGGMLARHEHDRAAESVVVGLLGRERFTMGCACLAAFGEISTCLRAKSAVATAVGKPFCFDEKFVVRRIAQGTDRRDAAFALFIYADLGAHAGGVEQKRDVGFGFDLLVKQEIPLRVAAVRVAHGVLKTQFLKDAGFAAAGLSAMGIGADNVHADLAGCVASKDRAVLHENDARPVTGCGDCGDGAGHATSHHDEISRESVGFDAAGLCGVLCGHDLIEEVERLIQKFSRKFIGCHHGDIAESINRLGVAVRLKSVHGHETLA